MSKLNPEIDARLGWARTVDPARLMTDPELRERLATTYIAPGDLESPTVEPERVRINSDWSPYPVEARLYRPAHGAIASAVVCVHGGGFLGGSVQDRESDGLAREIVARTGSAVVSVDYRLASADHHFPALHREVLAALDWTCSPEGLDLTPRSVVLAGASAGASLCATVALELRERNASLPAGLALVYPLLFRTSPGVDLPGDIDRVPPIFRILQPSVEFMFDSYIGSEPVAEGGVPASLDDADFHGMPPSLVVAAEYDDLAGHAHEFVRRTAAAGNDAQLLDVSGMPHGFLQLPPSLPEVESTLQAIAEFLSGHVGPSGPR
ncbi:alpha/beta hydrolase [Demequina sp. NBRC 110056]|uniref:alpha/beta hydrolase n=1 Tax=Demequina sp. NBRC 110056 TaxID=1570345 RepID=UPI000A050102|nr:alpha/beta hydrolase [Demequina sp. NBRC 110056]